MKKTSSDGVQEGTQRSCAERKQNSIGTSVVAQPISAQTAASQATAIQPVAANQHAVVDVCANPVTTGLGVVVSSTIIKEKPTVFIDTPVNQEQVLRHCEQSNQCQELYLGGEGISTKRRISTIVGNSTKTEKD